MKRKQLPANLRDVLAVSRFVNLYLLEIDGKGNFLFSDQLCNKFEVSIGNKVKCSCLPGHNDHCMHTFYVLSKIYQLDQKDPLLFQESYTQIELDQIINGKRKGLFISSDKNNKSKENFIDQRQQLKLKAEDIEKKVQQQLKKLQIQQNRKTLRNDQNLKKMQIQKKQQTKKQQNVKQQVKRYQKTKQIIQPGEQYPIFDKSIVCSICYQHLSNQSALIKCQSTCQNYFHTKCLKFWVDYQKKNQNQPSCPMCRCKLIEKILQEIKLAEFKFVQYYQSHQMACEHCGEDIKIKLFRCLLCKNVNICQKCYSGWKHQNHDRYLMKKTKFQPWSCAEGRSKFSMAKLDVSLQYIKQFKDQQQMKIIFGANYDSFVQAHLKKQTILEYLKNSLISVEKEITKTFRKLDYQQKDIRCCMCGKGKITQMRRLSCKHFIDNKCLTFLLVNGQRQCPLDKTFILPVFQSLSLTVNKK